MKKLMAANWKMFKTRDEARETARELVKLIEGKLPENREALILPPFTSLGVVDEAIGNAEGVYLGGQNFHAAEFGAFTGEIAPDMLLDARCTYALAGHSERRHIFGEDSDLVGVKTAFGLSKGLKMILCVGEKIEERKAGHVEAVLSDQLEKGLADVDKHVAADAIVIAYEPVWAIGTGETAGPQDIVDAHAYVRKELKRLLPIQAEEIRIQYGGSVKPENASEIISLDNVDGVLVGGASLKAESFSSIVLA